MTDETTIKHLLREINKCSSINNNCDFLLEHSEIDILMEYITNLEQDNQKLKEKTKYLKSKIENKDNWCQLIADIGYDYDGYRKTEDLMSLIDELVKYALYSRDDYDYLEWIKNN